MRITENFTLDHFLFSFHPTRFAVLPVLCGILRNCEHTVVSRPDISYEGVYLIAHNGNYLELLKYDEEYPNIFGAAISSLFPDKGDTNQLPKLFPELPWANTQIFDDKHNPWFTHYGQAEAEEAIKQKVIFWAMHYQNLSRHRPYSFRKKPPSRDEFSVQEFLSARGKIPVEAREIIKQQAQWLPGTQRFEKKRVTLTIPNASQNKFKLELDFDENTTDSLPVNVTLRLLGNIEIPSKEYKGFQLTQKKDVLIMNFTD
ncbi:MAG: hypothetical protein ACFFAL_01335 [Promethearchaeota archaeon]